MDFPEWRGRNRCGKTSFRVLCAARGHFTSPRHVCALFRTVLTQAPGSMLIPKNPFPGYYWAIFRASVIPHLRKSPSGQSAAQGCHSQALCWHSSARAHHLVLLRQQQQFPGVREKLPVISSCSADLSTTQSPSLCHRLMTNYVTFVVGEVLLLILTICSMAAIFPRVRGILQFNLLVSRV